MDVKKQSRIYLRLFFFVIKPKSAIGNVTEK